VTVPFISHQLFSHFSEKAGPTYSEHMHRINDAIVTGGKLVLSGLPFAEGQHVEVVVAELPSESMKRNSISDVRSALRGGVERYDDPFEPSIAVDGWEMLK
jgi:hypothetical protein